MSTPVDILKRSVFLQPILFLHHYPFPLLRRIFCHGKNRYDPLWKKPATNKRAGLIHSHVMPAVRCLLHRQLFTAAGAAGSQNTAAVLGRHTGTEAVHLAALTLFGLIRTEHLQQLLTSIIHRGSPDSLRNSLNSIRGLRKIVKNFVFEKIKQGSPERLERKRLTGYSDCRAGHPHHPVSCFFFFPIFYFFRRLKLTVSFSFSSDSPSRIRLAATTLLFSSSSTQVTRSRSWSSGFTSSVQE